MADKPISLGEPIEQVGRVYARYRRRKLIYFGGCDYYRLASDRRLQKIIIRTLKTDGLNVSASRVTTGNHRVYEQLEAALRGFFQVEAALVVSTGYTANLVIAQALAGEISHVIIDARAHPSLRDAAQFLDCPVLEYKHCDSSHAGSAVARCGRFARIALLTDGVFAQDGTLAPLPGLLRSLPGDAVLLIDDAHGAGVLGKNGRGVVEHFGIRDKRVVRSITLSKALGAFGGAVLGSKHLRRKIIVRSRLFAGSTPPPLPLAKAAGHALARVRGDSRLRARLRKNVERIGREFPVISIVPATHAAAAKLGRELLEAGIFPSLIRYPGGPQNGCFRFAISSEHTGEQIGRLLRVIDKYQ